MADEQFNVSLLDPKSWEEPRELIPVRVSVSRFRWSDPKYNEATDFRPAFPHTGNGPTGNSIQQWDFQLERLDAVYVNEDGSHFVDANGKDIGAEIPVKVYAGVDLQKLDKEGVVRNVQKTRGKEQLIVSGWTKALGSLIPPERLEGMLFMVEHFREKEINNGFFAKNVNLPVETLAPTYVFTGQVQRFKANKRIDVDTGTSGTPTAATVDSATLEEAAVLIGKFLKNETLTAEDCDASTLGHPNFPAQGRIDPFTTAFAAGTVSETLAQYGVKVA